MVDTETKKFTDIDLKDFLDESLAAYVWSRVLIFTDFRALQTSGKLHGILNFPDSTPYMFFYEQPSC